MSDPNLPPSPADSGTVPPGPSVALPSAAMTGGPSAPTTALPGGPELHGKPVRRKRWVWPVAAAACLLFGFAIGGSSSDGVTKTRYDAAVSERDALAAKVDGLSSQVNDAKAAAQKAESTLADQKAALDSRSAALDTRQADLEKREAAVGATEKAVAASRVGVGTWTVGVDIQPGTYRAAEAVTGSCYWAIYRSGSNGNDILQNDIVQGGFPTVTLKDGQDFKNGCGDFVKQ
ncbi:hypothetical protein [Cellulomonas sp. P24]|uniref:hypothetical protein n=1 Tax=Cellulomonas sp. P24 TaxID=2885206 RepID=UPI00216AC9F9|nr:hypothetical protein [Cellulomonas sp. P24]MCR6492716.1 hypothetical protein [Cellulomonas sp. P24]